MKSPPLLTLESVYGIFCDAWVDDDEMLVFASLWGRDSAIQELLARLTLSNQPEGIHQLYLTGATPKGLRVGNPERLDKLTGRMPKANLFGDMVHLWLFDKQVREPDLANSQAYLLIQPDLTNPVQVCWALFKSLSHLPLLDSWQTILTDLASIEGWLKRHRGYGLDALAIKIPKPAFEAHILRLIQSGELSV